MNPYHYTQFHFLTLFSSNSTSPLIGGGAWGGWRVVTQSGCFPVMDEHCVKRELKSRPGKMWMNLTKVYL